MIEALFAVLNYGAKCHEQRAKTYLLREAFKKFWYIERPCLNFDLNAVLVICFKWLFVSQGIIPYMAIRSGLNPLNAYISF